MKEFPSKYEVRWEKWIDAYQNEDLTGKDPLMQDDDFFLDDELSYMEELPEFEKPILSALTPFGLLSLPENALASTHFKFWTGHCNFNILKRYIPVIEQVLGVETVCILTPLRFRIGIGKMFRDRDVMDKVGKRLLNELKK